MQPAPDLSFHDAGPFDLEERKTIRAVCAALAAKRSTRDLIANIARNVSLLDRMGSLLGEYPSLFETHYLGKQQRDLKSLVNMLSQSQLSNFEMFLPTRALVGRTLIMAEMNFYRLLRFACNEALEQVEDERLVPEVNRHLCRCIYTRLAGEVLTSIASDGETERKKRERAVLALLHIWDGGTHEIGSFLSVLEATWEARRRVKVAGGTLIGTAEMFQLLQSGCDPRFVDLLSDSSHAASENEAAAFREFLFGATTEQLAELERKLADTGRGSESVERLFPLTELSTQAKPGGIGADPALAMFEFFLSRHLQAAVRRQADLPGPKRTAEEYVMRHYLDSPAGSRLGVRRSTSIE